MRLLTCLALVTPLCPAAASPAPGRPPGEPTAQLSPKMRGIVAEACLEAVWQVGTPFSDLPAAWQSPNREKDLRAYFGPAGVRVTPFAPDSARPWVLSLGTAAIGRGDALSSLGTAELAVDGARVEYRHPGLTEWYVNDARGLEQGWTLDARPAGSGELVLLLADPADLRVRTGDSGQRVTFLDGDDHEVASLGGLASFDRNGRALPSRFVARGDGLAVVVDDRGARYPITIDPTVVNENARLLADGAPPVALFGASQSVHGDRVLVGAPGVGDAHAGSAYFFLRDPSGDWELEAKVTRGPDARPGDEFGYAVDLQGSSAIVGAPGANDDAGRSVVLELGPNGWERAQTLVGNDIMAGDRFGEAVSVDNFWILVGAPSWDHPGLMNRGAVYAFDDDGSSWSQVDRLTGSLAGESDRFGQSLDMDFGWAAIGSNGQAYIFRYTVANWSEHQLLNAFPAGSQDYGALVRLRDFRAYVSDDGASDGSGTHTGGIYVFALSGFNWTNETLLTPSDGAPLNFFPASFDVDGEAVAATSFHDGTPDLAKLYVFREGGSGWAETQRLDLGPVPALVALDGDVIVNGTPRMHGVHLYSGGALVLENMGADQWIQRAALSATNADPGDFFGLALAVSGDRAAIGAPGDTDGGQGAGAVYVLQRTAGTWNPVAKLTGGALEDEGFGKALAMQADRLVVGAPDSNGGSVYVFERNAAVWSLHSRLAVSDDYDGFGRSLQLDGDRLLVGAPLYQEGAGQVGGAFLFTFDGMSWGVPERIVTTTPPGAYLGHDVALDGDVAVLGAPGYTGVVTLQGAVYVFDRSGIDWSLRQRIDNPAPADGDIFGHTVALQPGRIAIGEAGGARIHTHVATGPVWVPESELEVPADHSFASDLLTFAGQRLIAGAPNDAGGSAHVFRRAGSNWIEEERLVVSDTAPDDAAGYGVAASGNRVLIGLPGADDQRGAAAVFDLGPPAPFVVYCSGDGSAANACPCGNGSAPGEGCANSTGSGAQISASGSASIADADLIVILSGAPAGKPAMLFSGNMALGGTPFGDGLRCVGGATHRHALTHADAGGGATWGPDLTWRFGIPAGQSVYLQVLYRDPAGPCANLFNLTPALAGTLTP